MDQNIHLVLKHFMKNSSFKSSCRSNLSPKYIRHFIFLLLKENKSIENILLCSMSLKFQMLWQSNSCQKTYSQITWFLQMWFKSWLHSSCITESTVHLVVHLVSCLKGHDHPNADLNHCLYILCSFGKSEQQLVVIKLQLLGSNKNILKAVHRWVMDPQWGNL